MQNYRYFEFIIIDDGSTDNSSSIIEHLQEVDARIRLIRKPTNQGLISALNQGLKVARGKYIARMDSDDISLPERFSKQVEYLEAHPDVGILGCRVRNIDQFGKLHSVPPIFLDDLSIRWHIFFQNPFYHSTVMLRKSILDEFRLEYDSTQKHIEDYGLWLRLLPHTKGENLSDVLLNYRVHPNSVSELNLKSQHKNAAQASSEAIREYFDGTTLPFDQLQDLSSAIMGVSFNTMRKRSLLISIYFQLWIEFSRQHQGETGLSKLKPSAIAWAARMILFPPFQARSLKAIWILTKLEWRWPLFLLREVPYYFARRKL